MVLRAPALGRSAAFDEETLVPSCCLCSQRRPQCLHFRFQPGWPNSSHRGSSSVPDCSCHLFLLLGHAPGWTIRKLSDEKHSPVRRKSNFHSLVPSTGGKRYVDVLRPLDHGFWGKIGRILLLLDSVLP